MNGFIMVGFDSFSPLTSTNEVITVFKVRSIAKKLRVYRVYKENCKTIRHTL